MKSISGSDADQERHVGGRCGLQINRLNQSRLDRVRLVHRLQWFYRRKEQLNLRKGHIRPDGWMQSALSWSVW